MKYNLLTILGPTASGKTSVATYLAYKLDGEIISADSRQVYKNMDLGTGKDISEYAVENKHITYHLIDIVEPGYKFNIYEYQKAFIPVFTSIQERNKTPILCGGSGLYIETILKGYRLISVPVNNELRKRLERHSLDELKEMLTTYKKLHNKTDVDTKKRAVRAIEIEEYYLENQEKDYHFPEIEPLVFGIKFERAEQRKRITKRLEQRLKEGMIEEVENLIEIGVPVDTLIYYGLEYKFISLYITGELEYEEMFRKLNTAIHQFSKRQMTWFRRMERNGLKIQWIDGKKSLQDKVNQIIELAKR